MESKELKTSMNGVYTTKEMAIMLGMTGKQLRRILRKMEKYNDGIYTRYAWTKKDFDAIVNRIKKDLASKQAKEEKEQAK